MPKPSDWWISPHFRQGDFPAGPNAEQKVAIFADRIRGWMLDPADRLLHRDPHAGFAVLAILGTYFEMIAKYEDGFVGEGSSGEYFRTGVTKVLSTLDAPPTVTDEIARVLYKGLRNGFYHGGFTTTAIAVSGELAGALAYDGAVRRVTLNPGQVSLAIQRHFSNYIARLAVDVDVRDKFERRFDDERAASDAAVDGTRQ